MSLLLILNVTIDTIFYVMNNKEMIDSVTPVHQIILPADRQKKHLSQLVEVYENAYGEGWIGKNKYLEGTLQNVTEHHLLEIDGKPAAALDMNRDRIISIAVHPDFQGKNLGVKLFREAANSKPNAWISIGVTAYGMLSTVLNENLDYNLVEDKNKIEKLYRKISGVDENYVVNTTVVSDPTISEVFSKKGIEKIKFIATHRPGSIHDERYQQLVFQNKLTD